LTANTLIPLFTGQPSWNPVCHHTHASRLHKDDIKKPITCTSEKGRQSVACLAENIAVHGLTNPTTISLRRTQRSIRSGKPDWKALIKFFGGACIGRRPNLISAGVLFLSSEGRGVGVRFKEPN
jgi:hypothetical protein